MGGLPFYLLLTNSLIHVFWINIYQKMKLRIQNCFNLKKNAINTLTGGKSFAHLKAHNTLIISLVRPCRLEVMEIFWGKNYFKLLYISRICDEKNNYIQNYFNKKKFFLNWLILVSIYSLGLDLNKAVVYK